MTTTTATITFDLDVSDVVDGIDLSDVASEVVARLDVDDITSSLVDQFDLDDIASEVSDRLDIDDVAERVASNIDADDVARSISVDYDDLANGIDLGALASEVDLYALAQNLDTADIAQVVADNVGLDDIASRVEVDVDEVVGSFDLDDLAQRVAHLLTASGPDVVPAPVPVDDSVAPDVVAAALANMADQLARQQATIDGLLRMIGEHASSTVLEVNTLLATLV